MMRDHDRIDITRTELTDADTGSAAIGTLGKCFDKLGNIAWIIQDIRPCRQLPHKSRVDELKRMAAVNHKHMFTVCQFSPYTPLAFIGFASIQLVHAWRRVNEKHLPAGR